MGTTKGHGKYITVEQLEKAFEGYVIYEGQNRVTETVFTGKDGLPQTKEHHLVLSWEGFETYLADNKIINDLRDYRYNKDGRYSDYTEIITRIGNKIYNNNFKGAATNQLNSNLIARQLGIKEQTNVDLNANVNILNLDPLSDGQDSKD